VLELLLPQVTANAARSIAAFTMSAAVLSNLAAVVSNSLQQSLVAQSQTSQILECNFLKKQQSKYQFNSCNSPKSHRCSTIGDNDNV